MSLAERLLARRQVTDDGCWEWQGYRMPYGYGQIGDGQKVLTTHRAAFQAFVGPIPDGLFVCHKCDNPPCFNPEHLFLGTPQENAADMAAKGRGAGAVGLRNSNAKLTDTQVVELVNAAKSRNYTYREIAERFGVSAQYVGQLVNNKWRKNVER